MPGLFQKGALLTFLLVAVFAAVGSARAYAQFRVISAPDRVVINSDVNLFLRYEASDLVRAIYLDIPDGWSIRKVVKMSREGSFSVLSYHLDENESVLVLLDRILRPGDTLCFQLHSDSDLAPARISMTPVTFEHKISSVREDLKMDITLGVDSRPVRFSNKVAFFDGTKESGIVLSLPASSAFSGHDPYTVSMWMKTTGLNEVLISSWTGKDEDDYAAELVVNPAGFLEFYRGYGSQHVSLHSSEMPVADGKWHFVALINDPVNEWTRLSVDGETVDSLYHTFLFPNSPLSKMGLGRRLGDAEITGLDRYTGQMDLFLLSSGAFSKEALRNQMQHPSPSSGYLVDFEKDIYDGIRIESSDLTFRRAPRLVVEMVATGVQLKWESDDPTVFRYSVQRSFDGQTFEEIALVHSDETSGMTRYEYLDVSSSEGVLFYRLLPHYADGPGEASRAMKVGLGEVSDLFTVELGGNFPNPFNPVTTITYSVEESQYLRISVWDLSGQMIAVLVDGTQSPGYFEVPFHAEDLPSGTYFVRMESGSGIQTSQIVLMK